MASRRTGPDYTSGNLTVSADPPSRRKLPAPPRDKVERALMLKEEARQRYNLRNAMIADIRRRIDQERAVSIPRPYRVTAREVRLPLLPDMVELMTAIIDEAEIRVRVDPYDEGPVAKRNSGVRERWAEAIIQQMEDELARPCLSMCTRNQMGDGIGVLKAIYRPASWRNLPTAKSLFGLPADELDSKKAEELARTQEKAKRGARLPFGLVDVDPLTYLPIMGPDGETEAVVELNERPLREVMARYGDRVGLDGAGRVVPLQALGEPHPTWGQDRSSDTRPRVEFWEYHDRQDAITFVEDVPIAWDRHNMGMTPYFDCYARPHPSREPERQARPPAYKQVWLIELLDQLWTIVGQIAFMFGYPTPVTSTPLGIEVPKGQDGRPDAVTYEPGKHMVLWQGQTFAFATPPIENLQFMSNIIQEAIRLFELSSGLGPSIRGLGGAAQPGYAINQLIQASLLSLGPATKSREKMVARLIAYLWRLVERRVDDRVWAWATNPDPDQQGKKWLSLGPKDIGGYYRVAVQTKPLVNQLRIPLGQFGASMVKSKMLDRRTAIEDFLGYDDPDQIMDAIAVDEALEEPDLKMLWRGQALRRAGLAQALGPGGEQAVAGAMGGGIGMAGAPSGLPPQPGQGMPLAPQGPEGPAGLTPTREAEFGSYAMPPGRAAGAARQGPQQPQRPLSPDTGGP